MNFILKIEFPEQNRLLTCWCKRSWRTALCATLLSIGLLAAPVEPQAHEGGDFQIIKATETIAWRMNRKTGEIAVCKLDGDTLICSSSTTAVTKTDGTYETYKTEKENETKTRQNYEMAILDKILDFFKSFMTSAMNNNGN